MQEVSAASNSVLPKRQVVDRRQVHAKGEIVAVNVPIKKWVTHVKTTFKRVDLNYIQFGNRVHVYLHDQVDPMKFSGKTIVGQVEVWEKTMDDGAKYLYVDFMPLQDQNRRPTHKMTVVQGAVPQRYRTPHFTVVDTPIKDQGGVVLSPLQAQGF